MAHQATNSYSASYAQIGGGLTTCTNAVACGSGANRVVIVTHFRRVDRAIAIQSATLGGESMAVLGTDRVVSGNYQARSFAIVNPSVEGTQNLVITATTQGSNSTAVTIVSVYDDVDSAAVAADLLVADSNGTLTTPWTSDITLAVPSATGEQVFAAGFFMSTDVSYTMAEGGITERLWGGVGGVFQSVGDAAGAATVNVSWTPGGVGQDCGWAAFGFSLPPPSAGASQLLPANLIRSAAVGRASYF